MVLRYVAGDATSPLRDVAGNVIIVHVCNDVGGWGAGFVNALSARWWQPEHCYRHFASQYRRPDFLPLGTVLFVKVENDVWVANLIGQHQVRVRNADPPAVRPGAIRQGLRYVAEYAARIGATIHMPLIGTGLGGGEGDTIERIVLDELDAFSVTVYM
jgi:O-acetyl-ADP-ribose deacetylase (regulator of RNase III)